MNARFSRVASSLNGPKVTNQWHKKTNIVMSDKRIMGTTMIAKWRQWSPTS